MRGVDGETQNWLPGPVVTRLAVSIRGQTEKPCHFPANPPGGGGRNYQSVFLGLIRIGQDSNENCDKIVPFLCQKRGGRGGTIPVKHKKSSQNPAISQPTHRGQEGSNRQSQIENRKCEPVRIGKRVQSLQSFPCFLPCLGVDWLGEINPPANRLRLMCHVSCVLAER